MKDVDFTFPEKRRPFIYRNQLSLFIRGELGTRKSIVGTKFRRSDVCLSSPAENRVPIAGSMTASS